MKPNEPGYTLQSINEMLEEIDLMLPSEIIASDIPEYVTQADLETAERRLEIAMGHYAAFAHMVQAAKDAIGLTEEEEEEEEIGD